MKRSARRVDHGSSRLRSYGGACPSGRRYELHWMRTSAPSPLFRFGLQGCQKAKKINVLVARTLFYVRASDYTFKNGTKVSVTYLML